MWKNDKMKFSRFIIPFLWGKVFFLFPFRISLYIFHETRLGAQQARPSLHGYGIWIETDIVIRWNSQRRYEGGTSLPWRTLLKGMTYLIPLYLIPAFLVPKHQRLPWRTAYAIKDIGYVVEREQENKKKKYPYVLGIDLYSHLFLHHRDLDSHAPSTVAKSNYSITV